LQELGLSFDLRKLQSEIDVVYCFIVGDETQHWLNTTATWNEDTQNSASLRKSALLRSCPWVGPIVEKSSPCLIERCCTMLAFAFAFYLFVLQEA
jgi:hypothetical protein